MLDYRPDLDPRTPGVITSLVNFVPTARGYEAAKNAATHTAHTYTLDTGECYPNALFASRWLSTPGGIVITGTNKRLSVYDYSNGFINVSRAGDYTLGGQTFQFGEDSTATFDLCAFGDVVLACNKAENTQYRSALDLTSGTLFANLSGAPKANTCCVARNFVFLGNLSTTFGSTTTAIGQSNMLAWSGVGDHTDWSLNVQVTQSSYAVFTDTPGPITAVRPFRDGVVVFKSESMYLGRYVGSGVNSPVWDFERISDSIGCVGHRSVTDIGSALIFAGKDNIYSFDGTPPIPITAGIYETLLRSVIQYRGFVPGVLVSHDAPRDCVWFIGSFTPTVIYVWNYRLNRWGQMACGTALTLATCHTNTNDFRTNTLSTVTAGVQSFTQSVNHVNLYALTIQAGAPKNYNNTTATDAVLTTGVYGQADKLQTLKHVSVVFTNAPTTPTNGRVYVRPNTVPTGLSSVTVGPASMKANHRADVLGLAGMTANYFQVIYTQTTTTAQEVVDIVPTFVTAGER